MAMAGPAVFTHSATCLSNDFEQLFDRKLKLLVILVIGQRLARGECLYRRAASRMSQSEAASLCCIDCFAVGKYSFAAIGVSNGRLLYQIDLPPQKGFQLGTHFNPIEEVPLRKRGQSNQYVNIAIGSKIRSEYGAKEGKFCYVPARAEILYGYPI